MSGKKQDTKKKRPGGLAVACIVCAVILVGLLATAGVLVYRDANTVYPLIRAEAGIDYVDPDVFLRDHSRRATFHKGLTKEQLAKPGVYDVVLCCGGRDFTAQVEVVDTVAPTATANAVTSHGELPAPELFISQVMDATKVTVTYKSVPDVTVAGEQTVILLLTDEAGNCSEVSAQLTVILGGSGLDQ